MKLNVPYNPRINYLIDFDEERYFISKLRKRKRNIPFGRFYKLVSIFGLSYIIQLQQLYHFIQACQQAMNNKNNDSENVRNKSVVKLVEHSTRTVPRKNSGFGITISFGNNRTINRRMNFNTPVEAEGMLKLLVKI